MRGTNICLGCMKDKGQAEVCPFCGYREGTPAEAPQYLAPGTILSGKYLVGRGLGHGGFGMTYIARDEVLGIKLAIKEYLPQDCASRAPGSAQVVPFSGVGEQRFRAGLESFLQEARTLARFDGSPNIVGVRDFFTENGTAYLVMTYLEGITLKQYLVRSGGHPIPFEKMVGIMLPVMDALHTVHAAGLLHRDVSPDNIFLTTSGQVTLIDFGAARQALSAQQSMSVILKPGYAPEEQYRSRGRQGPWTDIYALGATMYRTLTGKIPPESLERLNTDCLVPPSKMGISIPAYAEKALLKAMAVKAENRFATVEEFRAALLQEGQAAVQPKPAPTTQRREKPQKAQNVQKQKDPETYPLSHKGEKKKKNPNRAIVIAAAVVLTLIVVFVVLFFVYLSSLMDKGGYTSLKQLAKDKPAQTQQVEKTKASEPTETPTLPEESPAEEEIPTPTPTIVPEMLPFLEGMTPSEPIDGFIPERYRVLSYVEDGYMTRYVTGPAPSTAQDLLVGEFALSEDGTMPTGGVYGYYLDESGNLKYRSLDAEVQTDELILPANCCVGMSFNGIYGRSTVYAVNYSGTQGGMMMKNAIVIKCDAGYAFYQDGIGLVQIRNDFDGGETLVELVSNERDNSGIYAFFVE